MKILRISLRNLAALAGTHTVDFTREPLRSTGLFAISGPTGSGKSTLLDALCLALYDATPRLAAANGLKIPDCAEGELITQKDPGNLLRRGTAEGFAEVAFVGVDALAYTARWSIRRARKNAEGSLQAATMSLHAGDVPHGTDGVLIAGGRKTEVLAAIAAKIGLSFDQFTRAVLLAQNDFAVFLKSDDNERALILQALTGTERFERISKAVFARNKVEADAVLHLQNQLAGLAPLDPEKRAAAEAAARSASQALAAAEAACAERERHLAWFQRRHEIAATVAQAAQAVATASAALQAAAPRRQDLALTSEILHAARPLHEAEQRELTQRALAAGALQAATHRLAEAEQASARLRHTHEAASTLVRQAALALDTAQPKLERARTLDAQLIPFAKHLADAQLAREHAELACRQATEKHQSLARKIDQDAAAARTLARQREDLAAFAPFTADASAWIDRLVAARLARETLAAHTRDLAAKRTTAADLASKAAAAESDFAASQSRLAKALAHRLEAESRVKTFSPEALAQQRRSVEAERQDLLALQTHTARLHDLVTRARSTQTTLDALQSDQAKNHLALELLTRTTLPAALSAWETSQAALALVEAAADQAVPRLRESLQPHKPCPVCGSEHHPYSAHAPSIEASALRALKNQVAEKLKTLETLRDQSAQLTAAHNLTTRQLAERRAELARLAEQIAAERTLTPASPTLAPLLTLAEDQRGPALLARLAETENARLALETREDDLRRANDALAAARLAYDQAQTAHTQAGQQRGELARLRATADAARDAAATQTTHAEAEAAKHLAGLDPLWQKIEDARPSFVRDAAAFIAHFSAQVTRLRTLEKNLADAAQTAAQAGTELAGLCEAAATAAALLAQRRQEETTVRTQHDTLRAERATLLGGRPANDVATELQRACADAVNQRDASAHALTEAEKNRAAALEAVAGQQTALTAADTRLAAAQAALDAWLNAFSARTGLPLHRPGLATYLTRDEDWLTTERAALEALAAAVQNATGAHEANTKNLDAHQALRPTPDEEPAVREDLATRDLARTAAKQRHLEAAALLASDDARRRDAAALLDRLTRQQSQAEPWTKLNELVGSADGAKFRSIAQRRTLDLLLGYANAQLDLITARYRLERLPESLNLIVRDRDMADERRSIHSLSGGESFLVSLALALGLASLTSNRLRIESLFIDEGFGSLDPATLNTAMNALTHLEAQGRKVGVISHVTEMADAIPVQIRVLKGRSGASRLEVPGLAAPAPACDPTETDAASAPAASAELTARFLAALQTAQTSGSPLVSSNTLRKNLGCETTAFNATRDALLAAGRIVVEGRSQRLAGSVDSLKPANST